MAWRVSSSSRKSARQTIPQGSTIWWRIRRSPRHLHRRDAFSFTGVQYFTRSQCRLPSTSTDETCTGRPTWPPMAKSDFPSASINDSSAGTSDKLSTYTYLAALSSSQLNESSLTPSPFLRHGQRRCPGLVELLPSLCGVQATRQTINSAIVCLANAWHSEHLVHKPLQRRPRTWTQS